jgi:hypothetical protein
MRRFQDDSVPDTAVQFGNEEFQIHQHRLIRNSRRFGRSQFLNPKDSIGSGLARESAVQRLNACDRKSSAPTTSFP